MSSSDFLSVLQLFYVSKATEKQLEGISRKGQIFNWKVSLKNKGKSWVDVLEAQVKKFYYDLYDLLFIMTTQFNWSVFF